MADSKPDGPNADALARDASPSSVATHDAARGVERLIFALDYPTLDEAVAGAEGVRGEIGMVKVGLELFCRYGPQAVARCGEAAQAPVFLDLKLDDIPATVGRATANVVRGAEGRVRYLTVHASGGAAMLRAAVEAAGDALEVLAVTVLTSLDHEDLRAMGIDDAPAAQVERLARLAHGAGVRAFVCSPAEAPVIRAALGDDVTIITPGVRPAGTAHADQKRVATPAGAIAGGSSMLVVGRPIREAPDPAAAARAIAMEIAAAL